MCSIFFLPAGINIPEEKLYRAVSNNPHGFGIILRDPSLKKIQVIREIKEETDYKEVKKILDENIDIDRYVHLRWATVGEKTLDNVHPFTSFWSEGRQVYFMHNGTLSDFSSNTSTWLHGVETPSPFKGWSDSRRYNHEIIMPLLLETDSGNGHGDITSDFTKKILQKFWNSHQSKGILISSDQGHTLINQTAWRMVDFEQEDGEVVKVLSSNDDYYDHITRGPEHERRLEKMKQERLQKEAAERASSTPKERDVSDRITKMAVIRSDTFNKIHGVTEEITGIGHFVINDDPESLSLLSYMSAFEVEDLVRNHQNHAVSTFISVTNALSDVLTENNKLDKSVGVLSSKVQKLREALKEHGVDHKDVEKEAA